MRNIPSLLLVDRDYSHNINDDLFFYTIGVDMMNLGFTLLYNWSRYDEFRIFVNKRN